MAICCHFLITIPAITPLIFPLCAPVYQIKLYQNLLAKKSQSLSNDVDRLENGLEKLKSTAAQVDDLKAKLKSQEVELKQKNDDADKLIAIVRLSICWQGHGDQLTEGSKVYTDIQCFEYEHLNTYSNQINRSIWVCLPSHQILVLVFWSTQEELRRMCNLGVMTCYYPKKTCLLRSSFVLYTEN